MSGLFPDGVEDGARTAGATAVVDKRLLVEQLPSLLDTAFQPLAA